MTPQQETDRRRAHAASVALQARIKRENAAHDARYGVQRAWIEAMRRITTQEQQKENRGAP